MVEIRRALHRHPELAFEEEHTAGVIIEELDRLGIPYSYSGKGSAVIGRLRERHEVTVALRAEMDALPGAENTDLPFASSIEGKMHACGHDAHMAMVLGAAAVLAQSPPEGNVLFVFQPAEERGGGARVVLKSGELEGVAAIFGGHVTHHYRVGEIMVAEGVITAQSDRFTIRVQGRGGHGARPHEATDAVVIAGMLITAIQTLVSREINPIYPSVVTIGRVEAGSAPNVIAETALLQGSIRTTLTEVRAHLHAGLERMAKALGELHNARISVDIEPGYPPVVNSRREAEICYRAAREVVGGEGLMKMDHPSMGSEDFSYYLDEIPGCYVRFGARRLEHEYIPLHSPEFDIDEAVLNVGASYFDAVARSALAEYRESPP
ncbi:MAG: amidohydrolase [Gammaproteobacteria bacterium]|nr:amidohydrolase [Gammaproteobacteria bacterium]NIM72676.1 amidohydrolase [Gammaproteobacteria bacterium]NIN37734.1 amidohydrolase [Gammaproteobacteria bacterium]NIO24437.1 amidohydrolase [Gammaproteobacteria bacterium]NIO65040.1 amidohydrolase [Gammaproteobacteria bacterium]